MASISLNKQNGCRTIQFFGADGKRRSIRLGKVPKRVAEAVKVKVERLVAAVLTDHPPDEETTKWVSRLDAVMLKKLASVGLVPTQESASLGDFIEKYIASRIDVSENTAKVWRQGQRHLQQFFGADKPLRSLSKSDGKDWRLHLIGKELADATVRKHCWSAKHFLSEAVDRGLITKNPFADLQSSPVGNSDRQYFVNREETQKVLDACPDAEWRLIVALSRYGGLRCPSEHMLLRWDDIHWDQGRFTVHSPKTKRHEGGSSRVVPLFSELLPFLEEVFDRAEPGTEYVISRFRNTSNLRTPMTRIVKRAGLKPWPRIFHNMRASRQTELEELFPSHVVCKWIGNSEPVARKHYLQVTEEHFAKAVQNAVQHPAVKPRKESQSDFDRNAKRVAMQGVADECESLRNALTGVDGNRTHQISFQRSHWV